MSVNTRRAAATSPVELARDVRRVAGGQPRTSADVLRKLATDRDRATREAVAANVSTPPDVLIALLGDSDFDVRRAAVTNPAAGLDVQRAACVSAPLDVREVLAQQPGLPAEIGALLARDPAREVRELIAGSTRDPAVLQTLLDDAHPYVRGEAAQNPHTNPAQRRRLTRDRAAPVRTSLLHAMAQHGWDIPEEDLLRLARDRSANVRFWLANLPGSTRAVYEILAEDRDDQIAVSARQWLRKPPRRGGFPDPARLGRPIVEVEHHIWNQYMSRG